MCYKLTFCFKNALTRNCSQDSISKINPPSPVYTLMFHTLMKANAKMQNESKIFTITLYYVYFVLDLQQSVSHLHRLSSAG